LQVPALQQAAPLHCGSQAFPPSRCARGARRGAQALQARYF
jgi:hypothetical protein